MLNTSCSGASRDHGLTLDHRRERLRTVGRERYVREVLLISGNDDLSSGFVAGCGEVDILEVRFWIGIERHPQSRPVHESKIKDRFEGLEQRPRVDLVVSRCHIPAGRQRGGSYESGDSSPVYFGQKPQGDLMARASRDSRVNNNVGVEENAHEREGQWRRRRTVSKWQGQGAGVAGRGDEERSDRDKERPRDDERP